MRSLVSFSAVPAALPAWCRGRGMVAVIAALLAVKPCFWCVAAEATLLQVLADIPDLVKDFPPVPSLLFRD